jgi:hypothetical protein
MINTITMSIRGVTFTPPSFMLGMERRFMTGSGVRTEGV